MSAHYNLRSQHSAVVSVEPTIPGSLAESPLTEEQTHHSPIPPPTERSVSRVESILRPVRSYSDVVRTRSVSPQPGTGGRSASVNSAMVSHRDKTLAVKPTDRPSENPFLTSSESENESARGNEPWTTVDRRPRMKADKSRKNTQLIEPDPVIEAEKQLTEEERSRILNRRRAEEKARSQELPPSTRGEGPSKGKGVDPRNWGDLDIEESELDMDVQYEALHTWAQTREWADQGPEPQPANDPGPDPEIGTENAIQAAVRAVEERVSQHFEARLQALQDELECQRRDNRVNPEVPKDKKSKKVRVSTNQVKEMVENIVNRPTRKRDNRATPPAVDAAAQIARKSYLGRAFDKIKEGRRRHTLREDDSSENASLSSSSSDESSSSSDSSSESSTSSDSSSYVRKAKSKKHSKKKKGKTTRKGRNTLKLVPPTEYDGTADSRVFHRFMTEGKAYLEDSNVSRSKQVRVLARYLKGKAHEFYTRQVSDKPEEWRLSEFLTELFNYCFPLDYRLRQRKKNCTAATRAIRE
ncbi:hypothetical protein DEU56DRAFT_912766 [Suillus clintonianus]|uniref:uncharacterized protein n=1 Tax=Suillus clintonianus TaxID=1904413 RepID=UPI001B87ABF6|nr:uncharacterized protein DEU56DRAFT_912766 [Suillus clintonianus]KAG2136995.1 hypothetical protein DEU56DRAFT_912766 [Suillus clintonianus]